MRLKLTALLLLWFVALPGMTACSIHYGSPEAVWFWCSMLHWCAP